MPEFHVVPDDRPEDDPERRLDEIFKAQAEENKVEEDDIQVVVKDGKYVLLPGSVFDEMADADESGEEEGA